MKESIRACVQRFAAEGIHGMELVTELCRFRALDGMLQASTTVRQWGITGEKLYELAQQSTVEQFGPLSYDLAAFERLYGPSFAVEIFDLISETGYMDGISAGLQWAAPLRETLARYKNSDTLVFFAYVEEYAGLIDEILTELTPERVIFYTPSESAELLLKLLYPTVSITNEWPEDVIFDAVFAASTGLFMAPSFVLEEMASRCRNLTDEGQAQFFVPLSALEDQKGINRVSLQFMLRQRKLQSVFEWAPLGCYEFAFGPEPVKKVALEIRELEEEGYRRTPLIALPHDVLASMEVFSIVDYALSLCGHLITASAEQVALYDDGYLATDYRVPSYMQRVFQQVQSHRLYIVKEGTEVSFKRDFVEGPIFEKTVDDNSAMVKLVEGESDKRVYWLFTNPMAAYVWYVYMNSEQAKARIKALAHMVISPEAFAQLLGSFRRLVLSPEQVKDIALRYCEAESIYKEGMEALEEQWQEAQLSLSDMVAPSMQNIEAEEIE